MPFVLLNPHKELLCEQAGPVEVLSIQKKICQRQRDTDSWEQQQSRSNKVALK